jgi:hypothetical protein
MSVHDNNLIGYTVDGSARRIELRTERREPGRPHERVDVIFDGVEAYAFRYDCLGNIIFDICEQPLEEALQAHWSEFDAGHRASGWPPFCDGSRCDRRALSNAGQGPELASAPASVPPSASFTGLPASWTCVPRISTELAAKLPAICRASAQVTVAAALVVEHQSPRCCRHSPIARGGYSQADLRRVPRG